MKLKLPIFILFILLLSYGANANAILSHFSDKSAPEIVSEFDVSKYYKGVFKVPFTAIDKDTSIKKVTAAIDGKDISDNVVYGKDNSIDQVVIDSGGLKDGEHQLTIKAYDTSRAENATEIAMTILTDNTPALITLLSSDPPLKQGKVSEIIFKSSEPGVELSGSFQGKDFTVYPYGKYYRLLLGVSVDEPGKASYILTVKAKDKASNISTYRFKAYVYSGIFQTVSFYLKPKKTMLLMPDTIRDDWKTIEDIVVEENDTTFNKGSFVMPTTGRISMHFGAKEFINGFSSGRHRGMDIANVTGTPIKAANNGIVRLAQRLPAHGNTIVIEHGQGLFTYYAHLSRFAVKVGSRVKKGQLIGYIGSTGVSSGPHLHFSVSLHNLRVDPMQWIDGTIVPFQKATVTEGKGGN